FRSVAGALSQAQRRLECALVALVDDERQVLLVDPPTVASDPQPRAGVRDLFDAYRDLHPALPLSDPRNLGCRPDPSQRRATPSVRSQAQHVHGHPPEAHATFRRLARIRMLEPVTPILTSATTLPGGGILRAFLDSGPMALVVFGSLAFLSVGSWAILLWKLLFLRRARGHSRRFLETFRNSK